MVIAIYYVVLVMGFLMTLIPPFIPLAQNQKLDSNTLSLRVTLPTTMGMLLLAIGFYGVLSDNYDDLKWQILIAISAAGALCFSCIAAFHSVILVRWRSD
jgi:MFS family permease